MIHQWSAYQEAVFRNVAEGKGHTIVRARAGSGKTSTIMEALNHVPRACSVILFAFNKAIADELKKRAPKGIDVSTLHGYGFKQLRRAQIGQTVEQYKIANILDDCIEKGDVEKMTREEKRAVCKVVSLVKATLIGRHVLFDADTSKEGLERVLEEIDAVIDAFDVDIGSVKRYEFCQYVWFLTLLSKEEKDTIDFDDMIWMPLVLRLRVSPYDQVFIDETQDLNASQIELALRACNHNGRICAIGDDRQSIYSFRGADINAIDKIKEHLNAKELALFKTYRCAKKIAALAQTIVGDFECPDDAPDGIFDEVTETNMIKQVQPGDFVLSRSNAPMVSLCWRFLTEGRKAAIVGKDIGASLTGFIQKSVQSMQKENVPLTVPSFSAWIDNWKRHEIARLNARNRPTEAVEDKVACVHALAEGTKSINEILAKVEALFSNEDNDSRRITLSSTHKAKGLERDRVWLLKYTYMKEGNLIRNEREEKNLYYVAITRAKKELYLVRQDGCQSLR